MKRRAVALQLLVPAPHQEALRWKRRAMKDEHLPIVPEEIERAVAADEAWLAGRTRRGRERRPAPAKALRVVDAAA
jgi:hypothetical protein